MAEILLSLTIIGVVAAITLPSLTGNINERTWNTQRKALYARFSQAISLMPAINGYGTIKAETSEGAGDAIDTAAETFVTEGLAKVLKINNICDNTHLPDCGVPINYNDMLGSKKALPTTLFELDGYFSNIAYAGSSYKTKDTKAVAFETQNGESITTYYNQSCITEYISSGTVVVHETTFGFPHRTMCLNFIYDLNGAKGPNTVGKDIGFITVFNATDSNVVAPMPSSPRLAKLDGSDTITQTNAGKACTQEDPESRVPEIEELSAMYINRKLTNITTTNDHKLWSSTTFFDEPRQAWQLTTALGSRFTQFKNHALNVRCIKR